MNKIKLLYDVVKTMKGKEVFDGRLTVEGKKDEEKVLNLVNKFTANHQSGDVKADISLEIDCEGNKVKHESSMEFNKNCCQGHMHHHIQHDGINQASCCCEYHEHFKEFMDMDCESCDLTILVNKNNEVEKLINHRGLEIYPNSHKVFINGKEVQLTTKEYELLVFLALHPNIVFTKDQLFETIWGEDYCGETATIAVHIQKVRKKIEKNPANPEYIETIWGTGYRFNGG